MVGKMELRAGSWMSCVCGACGVNVVESGALAVLEISKMGSKGLSTLVVRSDGVPVGGLGG